MSYEVDGVKYEDQSAKNQRIIDKLVEREVYCCMTQEVEYMLSRVFFNDDNNPFDEECADATMRPECPECRSAYSFTELTVSELQDRWFEVGFGLNKEAGELEEGYLCPICGCWHKTIESARECCGVDQTIYQCDHCGKVLNEEQYEHMDTAPVEIYEWWAVSGWFGEKLKEQGCVVIDAWGKSYWGREATGQSISLDGCITNIAKEMRILDGMENDWGAQ